MKCKYCGCTEDKPCAGGCFWAKDDVCSNCIYSLGSLETLTGSYLTDPDIVSAVITFTDQNGEKTSFEITK